jgi:hypothetical protein
MSILPVPAGPTPAPTNLIAFSKQLALKLRDPVNDGTEDGKLFKAELRYNYLTRAFGKLLRNLAQIGFDVEKIYPQLFTIIDLWFDVNGNLKNVINVIPKEINNITIPLQSFYNNPIFEIFKVIGKKADGTISSGRKVDSTSAFDLIMGISTQNFNIEQEKDFFYVIINNTITLIANPKLQLSELHFLVKKPMTVYNATSEDLVIPVEYNDLYMSIAALEGSLDIGNANKVTMYRNEINGELQLLVAGVKNEAGKEKTDVTN